MKYIACEKPHEFLMKEKEMPIRRGRSAAENTKNRRLRNKILMPTEARNLILNTQEFWVTNWPPNTSKEMWKDSKKATTGDFYSLFPLWKMHRLHQWIDQLLRQHQGFWRAYRWRDGRKTSPFQSNIYCTDKVWITTNWHWWSLWPSQPTAFAGPT